MKNLNSAAALSLRRWWMLLIAFAFVTSISAQTIAVKGVVKDAKTGETIVGANVIVKGTTTGSATDINGAFTLNAPSNGTLVVKYIGYQDTEVPISGKSNFIITLKENAIALGEVVAIGYGQVKKNDLTGSVVAISADKMTKGLATSLTDVLSGQMAGVTVTSGGGRPGEGATIRIRGNSSIYASNDPLIVVDNVPLSSGGVNGVTNPLSYINPQDIETYTVLKDASATAIYGSRASNGVILITTKKGSTKKTTISYDGSASVSTIYKTVDVMSGDQYRAYMKSAWASQPGSLAAVTALMGTYSTNWQNQIFNTAFGHDHNLSVSGALKTLPYRVSVGYTDQDGILKTSSYKRLTAAFNLSPSLLNDHLKINLNAKGAYSKSRFADTGAIGAALDFDPTQPVYSLNGTLKNSNGQSFGNGYYMSMLATKPNDIGICNPLSVLTEKHDLADVYQSTGGAQFDYKVHWLPDLHANLNLAYDLSKTNGTVDLNANSPMTYVWGSEKKGSEQFNDYYQFKSNTVLDFYLNYKKTLGIHALDVMGGYSWQHFYENSWTTITYTPIPGSTVGYANTDKIESPKANQLVSFFGRLNYTLLDRYFLTFTLRDDGTSRFSKDNRWGLFPSAAFKWRVKNESFLSKVGWLSDLALRLGYGETGQQNVTDNWYPYIPVYTTSPYNDARYQFGNSFYNLIRNAYYNSTLKWETTTTYNIGLDFGLFNSRLNGSIELYKRVTNDLLNSVPIAAGTNFTNILPSNIGNLENKGIEVTLNGRPIVSKDLTWDVSANFSYNQNRITKLTRVSSSDYPGIDITSMSISGGTGNYLGINQVGYPLNAYHVYKQLYDSNGKPIEGAYANVGTTDNKYISKHTGTPPYTVGMNSKLTYKNWFFNFAMHSFIGNYNYNNVQAQHGFLSNTYNSSGFLKNMMNSESTTNFFSAQYMSDYYIQNASFLRLDNVTLGYTFDNLFRTKLKATLYGTVQNLFVITKYKGLDPENNSNGMDNNVYPHPRVFIAGLRVNF
jgi:iron complex outermembrane receptor protein